MDSFEFNKFAGAVLFTLLVTLGVGILAEELFTPHHPEVPGYKVAVAEDSEAAQPGGAEAESKEEVALPVLLAAADMEAGKTVSKKCQSCHSLEKGGPNKTGPDLWGVVGRQIASHEGFQYSEPMTEHAAADGDTWTFENLNHFLTSPAAFIPKTKMAFAGIKKPEDRANLLAYLRTLSDNPVPIPTQ